MQEGLLCLIIPYVCLLLECCSWLPWDWMLTQWSPGGDYCRHPESHDNKRGSHDKGGHMTTRRLHDNKRGQQKVTCKQGHMTTKVSCKQGGQGVTWQDVTWHHMTTTWWAWEEVPFTWPCQSHTMLSLPFQILLAPSWILWGLSLEGEIVPEPPDRQDLKPVNYWMLPSNLTNMFSNLIARYLLSKLQLTWYCSVIYLSNLLPPNFINMLSDPITQYSKTWPSNLSPVIYQFPNFGIALLKLSNLYSVISTQ